MDLLLRSARGGLWTERMRWASPGSSVARGGRAAGGPAPLANRLTRRLLIGRAAERREMKQGRVRFGAQDTVVFGRPAADVVDELAAEFGAERILIMSSARLAAARSASMTGRPPIRRAKR